MTKEKEERVFKAGDLIHHTTFGEGTVISVSPESIVVQFNKKHGKAEKTLLLKYNKKSIL